MALANKLRRKAKSLDQKCFVLGGKPKPDDFIIQFLYGEAVAYKSSAVELAQILFLLTKADKAKKRRR